MVKPRVSQGETLKSAADLLDSAPAILIEVPMRRIGLVVLLAVILAWEPTSGAQPEGKTRVIGFLGPPPSAGGLVQAFQQGLRDLGYVEGQNIRVEYRYTDAPLQGDIDRMAQLAAELVRLKPDVLVVSITEAALAAKSVTRTIPIVMANAADPVAAGLVSSLAHPGGNITGLARLAPELVGKNLELLKEAVPEATRIGVLANPRNLSATRWSRMPGTPPARSACSSRSSQCGHRPSSRRRSRPCRAIAWGPCSSSPTGPSI